MNRKLLVILVLALAVRLAFVAQPGYIYDLSAYRQWASIIATHGPLALYAASTVPRVDYPPGYLYALWAVGAAHGALGGGDLGYRLALKTLPIVADLALIVSIYEASRRMATERAALWVAAAAALLPPLWFDSAFYGQSDSVPLAFAFSATLAMLAGNVAATVLLLAVSILIKPQALLVAPTLAVLLGRFKNKVLELVLGSVCAIALAYLAALPFTTLRLPLDVFSFVYRLYTYGAGKAPYTTDGAFNLYAVISPFYSSDMHRFGPITYHALGLILVLGIVTANAALLAWSLWKRPDETRRFARALGAASLSLLALFLFATRMHERYLLPALVFGAPLALDGVASIAALLWLAFTFTINLAFIMVGFYGGNHHPIVTHLAQAAAIGNIVAFGILWQRQWVRLVTVAS